MSIVIDNPGEQFHLLQCYYALKLEADTGMRHSRGSVLKMVQERYGVKSRTKRGACVEIAKILHERYDHVVRT